MLFEVSKRVLFRIVANHERIGVNSKQGVKGMSFEDVDVSIGQTGPETAPDPLPGWLKNSDPFVNRFQKSSRCRFPTVVDSENSYVWCCVQKNAVDRVATFIVRTDWQHNRKFDVLLRHTTDLFRAQSGQAMARPRKCCRPLLAGADAAPCLDT